MPVIATEEIIIIMEKRMTVSRSFFEDSFII
jgi:hypothetical protein